MSKLIAWHNDPKLKRDTLAKMRAHRDADELVQNYGYWEDGKGCAVGCLVESDKHADYEPLFGIPEALAHLEDMIFEGLSVEDAQTWPERFLNAIEPGADLSFVGWKFIGTALRKLVVPDFPEREELKSHVSTCREAIRRSAELMDFYAQGLGDSNAAEETRKFINSAIDSAYVIDAAENADNRTDDLIETTTEGLRASRLAILSASVLLTLEPTCAALILKESATCIASVVPQSNRGDAYKELADILIEKIEQVET